MKGLRCGPVTAPWKLLALCRESNSPEYWMATAGTLEADVARQVCYICPVRTQCLGDGLHEPVGIWGGLDEDERAQLVRNTGAVKARPPCLTCGGPLSETEPATATRHTSCAQAMERERRARVRQAAPGKCQRCGAELSWGISKCGACTWSPRSGPNSLPY